jgi:hypothetical protein
MANIYVVAQWLQAATLRLTSEEQEVEEACGCAHARSHNETAAPTPSIAQQSINEVITMTTTSPSTTQHTDSSSADSGSSDAMDVTQQQQQQQHDATTASDAAQQQHACERGHTHQHEHHEHHTNSSDHSSAVVQMDVDADSSSSDTAHTSSTLAQQTANIDTERSMQHDATALVSSDSMAVDTTAVQSTASPTVVQPLAQPLAKPLDELLSMGFTAAAAERALLLSRGDLPSAVQWLLLHADDDHTSADAAIDADATASSAAAGDSTTGSSEQTHDTNAAAVSSGSSRETRLQQAVAAVAARGGAQAAAALDLLLTMTQVVMDNPSQEKFRRVKLSNARLQRVLQSR